MLSSVAEVAAAYFECLPVRFGRRLYEAAAEPKRSICHPEALRTDILT